MSKLHEGVNKNHKDYKNVECDKKERKKRNTVLGYIVVLQNLAYVHSKKKSSWFYYLQYS